VLAPRLDDEESVALGKSAKAILHSLERVSAGT